MEEKLVASIKDFVSDQHTSCNLVTVHNIEDKFGDDLKEIDSLQVRNVVDFLKRHQMEVSNNFVSLKYDAKTEFTSFLRYNLSKKYSDGKRTFSTAELTEDFYFKYYQQRCNLSDSEVHVYLNLMKEVNVVESVYELLADPNQSAGELLQHPVTSHAESKDSPIGSTENPSDKLKKKKSKKSSKKSHMRKFDQSFLIAPGQVWKNEVVQVVEGITQCPAFKALQSNPELLPNEAHRFLEAFQDLRQMKEI